MYKKNLLLSLVVSLVICGVAFAEKNSKPDAAKKVTAANVVASDENVKAGYFNSALAISESKAGKESFGAIEKKRNEYAQEFKSSEAVYSAKVRDLQDPAKASTLSVAAREAAEKEIIKMKRDIENKAKGYEEDLNLVIRHTQEKLFKELSDAVYEQGRKEGKDVMVDVATGRVFIINPDKISSTSSIVQNMNTAYDKKSPATNASKASTAA